MTHAELVAQPLASDVLEAMARRIFERLPGCGLPNCTACKGNLHDCRGFVVEAYQLGAIHGESGKVML